MLHGTLSNGVSSSDFSVYFSALWDKNIEEQNTNAKQIKEGEQTTNKTKNDREYKQKASGIYRPLALCVYF